MKKIIYLFCVLGILSCNEQKPEIQEIYLSISPTVDKKNIDNQAVISVLEKFLLSKNNSPRENEYWLESDYEKYVYPYAEIYQIEKSKYGENYFKPSLMELIDLGADKKLLKIGYIGFNQENSESLIRCIYNIIAVKKGTEWKLKRALEYFTNNWEKIQKGSISYYLSEGKTANIVEMKKQEDELVKLCQFLETEPFPIIYYSCKNTKEVFEIKGFDYYPNMYFSEKGGLAEYDNIIFSGNNSEEYTHEIVHIYTKHIFPTINRFLDEGIATYIGGSGGLSYVEHRSIMKEYLASNNLDLANHTTPYERLYIDDKTPIPYMIGALICERTNRIYGKEKLFELFKSNEDNLWLILQGVNLNKENLTEELLNELKLSPNLYMQ